MIRPTIRQLEYLLALDNEKSFSRAAIHCNVTQSTLSAGIKDLENILGHQLVNRAGRSKITLTAFGNDVVTQTTIILNDVDHIVAKAKQMHEPLSGILRMGVIPTIAPYFLPHVLNPLQEAYPNLELQLYEDMSERLIEQLNKRQIDIALLAFPYATEGMECHDLFKEDFYLAIPNNKNVNDNLSIKDIMPEELLLLEEGHCMRDHALSACHLQPSSKRKTFSATSLATLIQMVGSGYGVTLLPEMVIKYSPMPKEINIISFSSPAPTRQIGLVWRSNSPQKRDLLTLLETLRNIAA